MKTLDEVKKGVEKIYAEFNYPVEKPSVQVQKTSDGVTIQVSKMYEYVDSSFGTLKKIAELVGSEKINVGQDHFDGCETCDYGSSYTLSFYVKDAKVA